MSHTSTPVRAKIFMLDNLDSFTYNLVDEFQCLGFDPVIYRNTLSADFILAQIEQCTDPVLIVLSPGPGEPSKAGCLMELIAQTAGKYPILGICLGHQALIEYYGGVIGRAPEIVHGKASNISHSGQDAFANIINPLPVARYHSLVATKMPECLSLIAQFTTDKNDILPMAITHEKDNVLGFQFHPESILTTYGSTLLAQSIEHLITKNLSGACHD
ncbi:aminodeoxychorismate/anthranilate synthase component II [Thalassotalea piscium]